MGNRLLFFAVTLLLFVTSCLNDFQPVQQNVKEQDLPPGMGACTLDIGYDNVRTIMPVDSGMEQFAVYELIFSQKGRVTVIINRANADLSVPISMAAGTYSLDITAYIDAAKSKPAARGSPEPNEFIIDEERNTRCEVKLKAFYPDGNGTGTFRWDISYPSGITSAAMTITPRSGSAGQSIDIFSTKTSVSETMYSHAGYRDDLNSGCYTVLFTLETGIKRLEWREILHIYQNLESRAERSFDSVYF